MSSECVDDNGVCTDVTFTVINRFGEAVEVDEFIVVPLLQVVVVVAVVF